MRQHPIFSQGYTDNGVSSPVAPALVPNVGVPIDPLQCQSPRPVTQKAVPTAAKTMRSRDLHGSQCDAPFISPVSIMSSSATENAATQKGSLVNPPKRREEITVQAEDLQFLDECDGKFRCSLCDITCSRKGNWKRHLGSTRHQSELAARKEKLAVVNVLQPSNKKLKSPSTSDRVPSSVKSPLSAHDHHALPSPYSPCPRTTLVPYPSFVKSIQSPLSTAYVPSSKSCDFFNLENDLFDISTTKENGIGNQGDFFKTDCNFYGKPSLYPESFFHN